MFWYNVENFARSNGMKNDIYTEVATLISTLYENGNIYPDLWGGSEKTSLDWKDLRRNKAYAGTA